MLLIGSNIRIKLNSFALFHMNANNSALPKTADTVRKELNERGESIADFSRRFGLSESTVHQVLNGRNKGTRGEAHRAAVLLGMKIGTITKAKKRS